MSSPVFPVANFPPASYPIPAPGDGVTSANTLQYVQPIVDGIECLRQRIPGAVNGMVRYVEMAIGSGSLWSPVRLGTGQQTWLQTGTTGVVSFMISHLLPFNGTIVGAFCLLDGGTGHSALPATMPALSLVKWPTNSGNANFQTSAKVTIQTNVDPSLNVTGYEKVHGLNLSTVAEAIALNSYDYGLEVSGEDGANAIYSQLMVGRMAFLVSQ